MVPAAPQTKSAVSLGIQESIPNVGQKSHNMVKDVKIESNGTKNTGMRDLVTKPEDKEKVFPLPTGKKKVQTNKSSAAGGSLANFWGRASAKSKPSSELAENSNAVSNSIGWFPLQFIPFGVIYSFQFFHGGDGDTMHLQFHHWY